jgi:hypothetical protein
MNFKRDSNLQEKSDKFSKITYWLDLHNSEFSWVHLYVRFWVTKQVSNGLVRIKEKCLNLKFKPYNIWYATQTCKDFLQASKIPSELPFRHCSRYSDTWSVTPGGHISWLHQLWALDAPCTDLSRHVGKVEFEKAPTPSRPTKEMGRPAPLTLDWARDLCHIIPSCHILCDYALFWRYWRYAWILVHKMLFHHSMFLKW